MLAHDTLLLASGSAQSRHALRTIFSDGFNLLEANSNRQTLLLLEQNHHCIASLVLDSAAGDQVSLELLSEIARSPHLKEVPVIVLTPPEDPAAVGAAFSMGAIEAMSADYDPFVLLQRVQNIVDLHRHKWHLEDMVQEQAAILQHSNDAMVDVLSSIIEYRSVESGQHILRIRRFTEILLREVRRSAPAYGLTDQAIGIISSAAALHDIGKISISDAILNKPGPLTEEERAVMQSHSDTGSRIVSTLGHLGSQEYLRYAYNICRHHHERWDGSGYPDGLAGDDIPICAQVVGLADVYDALTSKRVYKEAFSFERAATMICNGECGAFSPILLECFKHVAGSFAELARAYADGLSPKTEQFDTALPGPDRRADMNALQFLQAKYQMLLHYLDATVVEVDMDQGVYHVVYNPDPYLSVLSTNTSLQELDRLMALQAMDEGERDNIHRLTEEMIPRFLRDGLMRMNHRVAIYNRRNGKPRYYDLTILRQSLADPDLHRVIVVWHLAKDHANRTGAPHAQLETGLTQGLCVCRHDRWLTVRDGFSELCRLTGYGIQELTQQFLGQLMKLVISEDRAPLLEALHHQLAQGPDLELVFRLRHRDGRVISVLYRGRVQQDPEEGELLCGLPLDITAANAQMSEMQQQMARYKIILSQTENVLYEWDLENDTLAFSDSWEDIFGYPPIGGKLLGRLTSGSHFHPEDISAVYESMAAMRQGNDYQVMEVRIAKADGRYLWCRFRSNALRAEDGSIRKIVGIIINIDEEKRSAQALQERAERDALTKLLNKDATRVQAETYLSDFAGTARCALLIIDLDDFKGVNDQYGHLFGDQVLAQVAKEIKRLFRPHDIVGRIGGDEFLVLMRGIDRREVVEDRCRQLTQALRSTFRSHLRGGKLSCSVGVALFPQHGRTYGDLFKRADQALYLAKAQGKDSFAIYDSADAFYHARRKTATAVGARIDSDDTSSPSGGNIIHYAFRHLYESTDVEATISELLALIGRQLNVSRVYIFENSPDNRFCSNTFEWCNRNIQPQIDFLQNVSYETDIPTLLDQFDEQGLFYCPDVSALPDDLRQILEPQKVKSILLCAIRDNGVFRGYMGFDECGTNLYWTREQIDMLTYFAEMLSVFLLKKRAQDALADI